ncbi:MAG: lipid A deacylase LpxR family protein [Desulfobulbaceae bacterium]|nr:lipid A deacylase LpxR family protein [Desulfobulbaceae bacterium]
MLRKILIPLALFLYAALPLLPCLASDNPWTNTLYFENDLFAGTDQAYTNGVKYSLISPDLSPHAEEGQVPRRFLEYIYRIPFIRETSPNYSHKAEFSFGQNMYTPKNIAEKKQITTDRPYAGWSYFGMAYHRKFFEAGKPSFMDTVEVQFGLVGPDSFAEESQKFIHGLRDLQRPEGWDNQLNNEPGLVIAYERKWLFFKPDNSGFDYDAILHAGASLGNVSTYANTGMEIRWGWNISKNFGVSIIRPAGSSRLAVDKDFSSYLFAAVDGRAVALDIFLDGNNFTNSHEIDKKFFVADLATGISLSYKGFMLTFGRIERTKEFENQPHSHAFGSVVFSFFYAF